MDTATKPEQTVTGQPPYQQYFTMSKACRLLGVGKQTLAHALIHEDIQHTKNSRGHYKIPAAEVFRYQALLNEQRSKYVSETDIDKLRTGPYQGVELVKAIRETGTEPLGDSVSEPVQTSPDIDLTQMVPISVHEHAIERLEADIDEWKGRANRYEAKADNLLTDQRMVVPESPPEEGRAVWPWVISIAIFAGLGVVLYVNLNPVT